MKQTTENTGLNFNATQFLKARELAWSGLQQLAGTIKAGDTEDKIQKLYLDFFPQQQRSWHPPKIRFAKDTMCSFRDKSLYKAPLEKGDIFFFDFGPVFHEHEADVGDTFCLGNNDFINPAKTIFNKCQNLWSESRLSGVALYEKACEFSNEQGLTLNVKMHGHRLGDFPHALHHKGALGEFEACPKQLLWVLEIHVLNLENQIGYFFEDILQA